MNRAARMRGWLSRASRSQKAKATSASAHRQREIDEAEQEREIVGEGDREQGGRRHPAVHLVGDPEQAADGQRRDGQDDELHRGFEAEQGSSSSTSRSMPRLPITAHSKP